MTIEKIFTLFRWNLKKIPYAFNDIEFVSLGEVNGKTGIKEIED